jgi:hypothetical protein
MEALGHSTHRLTMDTYAHVMPAARLGPDDDVVEVVGHGRVNGPSQVTSATFGRHVVSHGATGSSVLSAVSGAFTSWVDATWHVVEVAHRRWEAQSKTG